MSGSSRINRLTAATAALALSAGFVIGWTAHSHERRDPALTPTADDRVRGEDHAPLDVAALDPVPESPAPPPRAKPGRVSVAGAAQDWCVTIRAGTFYGAGVVLNDQGYIVTNAHVLQDQKSVRVTFSDGRSRHAEVIERDDVLDLALLRTEPVPGTELRVASAATLSVGDEVFVAGSPRKMHFSVSRGIVSYLGRAFGDVKYIQTDLPINEGNSGGPVLNMDGAVVGVMSFILRGSQGLSFALPIDYVFRRFADHLSTHELGAPVSAAWLSSLDHE